VKADHASPQPQPVLVPLAPRHAAEAARLHVLGQPGTFLTSLGPAVLTEIYRALPASSVGFGFAVEDARGNGSGTLLGFISAATSVGRLFAEMGTRNLPALALPLMAAFVRKPGLLLRSGQTLLYPLLSAGSGANHAAQHRPRHSAELLSIMVEPAWRSRGLGAMLVAALVEACQERAVTHLDVTVDAGNDGAQRFYHRHGFETDHTIKLYGRPMVILQRALATDAGARP